MSEKCVPSHVPWWRLNRRQLASLGNAFGAFLAAFGAGRVIEHKSFGLILIPVGVLLLLPSWIMVVMAVIRRRRARWLKVHDRLRAGGGRLCTSSA
jgi:hypothetical protein